MSEIVFVSGNGSYRQAHIKAFFEPFERETGIKVVDPITTVGMRRILQMNRNGDTAFDVVTQTESSMYTFVREGVLEPIDYDLFDKSVLDEIGPENRFPYGVGTLDCAYVLGYDKARFPGKDYPNCWKDFWDVERFPGMRCLEAMRGSESNIEQALLADGVHIDNLYPLDMDRAFESLDRIRPSVHTWWFTGDQAVQVMIDQGVSATLVWDTRMKVLKEFGIPVDFTWNEAALMKEVLIVPKGAKNYREAMNFLNFVSRAQPQAELSKYLYSAPTNREAFKLLSEEHQSKLCTWPENRKNAFQIDSKWWGENGPYVAERAQRLGFRANNFENMIENANCGSDKGK
jgi:putative spermidine/putrescine transport system substrate-binding protein